MSQKTDAELSGPRADRRLTLAICILLAVAVWIVFGQTLRHQFINYDDDVYVYNNPAIIHGLTGPGIVWAFTHRHGVNWHPLTSLSHMLDCQLYDLHPGGHHFTNVLLHMAAVILLFLVLRNLTGALWPSALVAAVFAIHPLRVESVAWVSERKDVLSGLFFMLTLWAYARYARESKAQNPKSKTSYALTLGFFVCGLMSKPMLVTLPFVLLLLDYWPLKRAVDWRRPVLEKIPFLALTAAACVVTFLVQSKSVGPSQRWDLSSRIGNALVAYVDYIRQMLWPADLAVFYPHPETLPFREVGLAALLLLLITAGVLAGRRQRPYLLVGWLWYLGMLVPVIGLIQVGSQARADRYTYLPQIGLYIMVAWGVAELCGSWRYHRAILGSAAAVIMAGLMAAAYVQTGYWQDSVTLWTHTLACTPGNYVANNNFGIALASEGKLPEAIEQWKLALHFQPNSIDVRDNLGNTLAKEGRMDDALQQYQLALQLDPHDAKTLCNLGVMLAGEGKLPEAIQQYQLALQSNPDDADTHYNFGNALLKGRQISEAVQQYEQALQSNPDYAEAHCNLGVALDSQGNVSEAIRHFDQALELEPDYVEAHMDLGIALASEKKWDEAAQQYQQALQFKPDDAEARVDLGNALARQEKFDEAAQQYQQALQSDPDSAETHYDLANMLNQEGQLPEAIEQYQRAIQLKLDNAKIHLSLGVALAKAGRLPEATQQFEQSIQLEPDLADAQLNLGDTLTLEGKMAEAAQHYQKALDLAIARNDSALAEIIRTRLNLRLPAPRPQSPQTP